MWDFIKDTIKTLALCVFLMGLLTLVSTLMGHLLGN